MAFLRRQHNATLLPDGTVLVTGGTGGPGFNDLSPGSPVHTAELWDPATDTWTTLGAEDVDRCYHSTAVLLPDATVLSAGGGEFVVGTQPNSPADTHRDGQIFHPPYLFRGPRPGIASAPDEITLGDAFGVTTSGPAVTSAILVRLSSATDAFNANQRFVRVNVHAGAGAALTVTAPANAGDCPPGHYMLFALSAAGVPSTAHILHVKATLGPVPPVPPVAEVRADVPGDDIVRRATRSDGAPAGTAVTVGLTAQ